MYSWILMIFISLTDFSNPAYGYSKCYNQAENASIPAALLCLSNEAYGNRVVIDAFRAKESTTVICQCTITSATATQLNFSSYNNIQPGLGCGSTVLFHVNGIALAQNCFVQDIQLSFSSSASIDIENLPSSTSTEYCIIVESVFQPVNTSCMVVRVCVDSADHDYAAGVYLLIVESRTLSQYAAMNISCHGDPLSLRTPTQIPITSITSELTTSSSPADTTTSQLLTTDRDLGQTQCKLVSSSYYLPVVSLCYKTSASAGRVVLDGFLTYNSSISTCDCTLTSTHRTNISFTALDNLQPGIIGCGSSILVYGGDNSFTINCFLPGKMSVSPSQTVVITFEKPLFEYNSGYCMLLTPDNPNAVLTLNCDGDYNVQTTPKTSMLSKSTITTTTIPSKETASDNMNTDQQATIILGSTIPNILTTTTAETSTLTSSEKLTIVTTYHSATKTTSSITASTTTTNRHESSDEWSYWISLGGSGLLLIFVVILSGCCYQRKLRNNKSENINGLYSLDTNVNAPYKSGYDEESDRTSDQSYVTGIYSTIEDVIDDRTFSTNVTERKIIHHDLHVLQPIHDVPSEGYSSIYEMSRNRRRS